MIALELELRRPISRRYIEERIKKECIHIPEFIDIRIIILVVGYVFGVFFMHKIIADYSRFICRLIKRDKSVRKRFWAMRQSGVI